MIEGKNDNFVIPYYIFKELIDYLEITSTGRKVPYMWEYIKSLLDKAKRDGILTYTQILFLLEKYSRE